MKYIIILLAISLKLFSQNSVDTSFTGFKIEYSENKKPKKKIEYKKGKPSGLVITYKPNGQFNEIGTFVSGRWIGNYKFFHDNGQVEQDFNFDSNGKRIGLQKYYFKNGVLQILAMFNDNKQNGYSLEFDSLGKMTNYEYCLNGGKINKDDKIYTDYKEMLDAMIEIANKENELVLKSTGK